MLFLLALIVGSRRLREIVLTATTFTLAHSVTFVLAALGLVEAPAGLVEPLIAASIALWLAGTCGERGDAVHTPRTWNLVATGTSAWTARVGAVWGWSSALASSTDWGSRRNWASTSRGRGSCCHRC